MSDIRIVHVAGRSELTSFIDLPWKIYRDTPNWVPPLKSEVRKLLDTQRHPFWEFSQRELFLALQDGEPVGRLAAIVDSHFNLAHNLQTGVWGFFECVNDADVAQMLFAEAEQWLRGKGMNYLLGPFSPSTNYEIGLLVEGFEHRATFMMPYNHPYYAYLIEQTGSRKEKDLLSFIANRDVKQADWMEKLVRRLNSKGHFTVRKVDMKNFREEMALIKRIYDECWAGNWGFVPMTEREFDHMVEVLRKIADPDFVYFVFYKDEPAAIAVLVPDINPLLKRFDGRIGLTGILKALVHRKDIRGLRGLLFGIKEQYRQYGLPYLALDYLFKAVKDNPQYEYVEFGWNLEDNEEINQLEQDCGARFFKRYRLYGKPL